MAGDRAADQAQPGAAVGAQTGMATEERPPTGATSIADAGQARRRGPAGAGGEPSGSITAPEGEQTYGGTLAKDENGIWTYTDPDGFSATWEPSSGSWRKTGGGWWHASPPEELAAQLSDYPNRPPGDQSEA